METWAVPFSSSAVERIAQMLEPEKPLSEQGPIIYFDRETCIQTCRDILYACIEKEGEEGTGFVCQMDTTMLLMVVIIAILTGILIPILCIFICMCTRFCGMFDDHLEAQNLIHSDLRQDWDTYPSSGAEFAPQVCNQNEVTHCSTTDASASKLLATTREFGPNK